MPVNLFGSLPRNSVPRLTDRLDITILVDGDVKPQIKQTNKTLIHWSVEGLYVSSGLNVAFNNFSVISRRCLVATGSSVLTFIVLSH